MNLVVTLEYRFDATPDGMVWTQTMFPYSFWTGYLDVFSCVKVVSRARQVAVAEPDWQRADGENVHFVPIPYYLGPSQYLLKMHEVRRAALAAIGPDEAVIMRVSSNIASVIEPILRRTGRPYGLEVVGNPHDVFAPGTVKHPLRPFFRWWFSRRLGQQCAHAAAVAYVTERTLQQCYPPAADAYTTHYSSLQLPDEAIISAPRMVRSKQQELTLVFVGSLAQLYKAPDVLIEAVALVTQRGLDIHLTIIGDGKYRPELEEKTDSLGLAERVRFLGQLSAGEAIRTQLDAADLFVLPSRTEGLPRAMIEAMARGLPCIGSTVGGIPELLPAEDMVPAGDAAALAQKISEVTSNPERMTRMSARNLEKAREYREDVLRTRRIALYQHVKAATETWLRKNP